MKQTIITLTIILLSNFCKAQDFQSDFNKYCQEGDTLKLREILTKWEMVNPNDPELFTSYFNYYFLKAKQEVLTLTTDQPNGESLTFQDSTGKTAGFIGSQITFNSNILQKGLDKIDEGIKLYPNRLDMRFGKIYALGESGNWRRFTDEVIKTVQYSSTNDNNWIWTNNEQRANGKEFFLSSLQDYQLTLYNTADNELLTNMREIANEILKIYPNHIESLSNLSITYLLINEYDKGLEPLLKAEKINPKDGIVLSNIAHGYRMKGNKKKAIKYYKKMLEIGDDEAEEFAKQQIEEIKATTDKR